MGEETGDTMKTTKTVRQFVVFASDGAFVCIENKATPKSALRIAARIGGTVMESVSDGSYAQYRAI